MSSWAWSKLADLSEMSRFLFFIHSSDAELEWSKYSLTASEKSSYTSCSSSSRIIMSI